MKITTSQQQNAASSCCDCAVPQCAEPRMMNQEKTGSANKLGWPPYIKPAGDDSDLIPSLYETPETAWPSSSNGFAAFYNGWFRNVGIGNYFEVLQELTINRVDTVDTSSNYTTSNQSTSSSFTPITPGTSSTVAPYGSPYFFYYFLNQIRTYDESLADTVTLTQTYHKTATTFESSLASRFETTQAPPALQGASGTADLIKHHFDVTDTSIVRYQMSDPFTPAGLRSDAESEADADTWSDVEQAVSSVVTNEWPLIGDPDFDSITENEDGYANANFGNWPDYSVSVDVVKGRYKIGVPADYSTTEIPRSVYEVQWDVVSATVAWWAWYDASMTGTEPTPGPSLVASKEWTWGGSMATEDDQFSEWFEMTLPDAGMETRIANGMVKCYRSTRTGVKPTAWGNQIAIEES